MHHDADDNQQLDIDELRSAAEVVVATEEIQEELKSLSRLLMQYQICQ